MLNGRYAGKKAVIVKIFENKLKSAKFSRAVVVGVDKYPKKVTNKMGKRKILQKSSLKPFLKIVNLAHVLPTRFFFFFFFFLFFFLYVYYFLSGSYVLIIILKTYSILRHRYAVDLALKDIINLKVKTRGKGREKKEVLLGFEQTKKKIARRKIKQILKKRF
jgi:hypothetical protein